MKKEEKFNYMIDQKPMISGQQFITGAQIRAAGNVPAGYSIFLKVNGPGEDQPVLDTDQVDLGQPGREHFYSSKPNTNNG